jgi:hypothetical protein
LVSEKDLLLQLVSIYIKWIIETTIYSESIDPEKIKEFQEKGYNIGKLSQFLDELLNDLCFQGKLEAGDYIIKFDD